jgi:hypothetical protein
MAGFGAELVGKGQKFTVNPRRGYENPERE